MDSPQTQVWGPHLWIILHSVAERIGQPHLKKLSQEETRLWTCLLRSLRYSLPCPVCKSHYNTFYSRNTITNISQEFIRNWLYKCHNTVNNINKNVEKIGEKTDSVTIEQVPLIYSKPFNFTYHFGFVTEHMTRAIRLGWCSREDIGRTVRVFYEMKRFYDLF